MQAERLRRRAGVRHDGGVSVAGGTGVASRKFALSRTRQTSPHWFPALQPYRRTKTLVDSVNLHRRRAKYASPLLFFLLAVVIPSSRACDLVPESSVVAGCTRSPRSIDHFC